MNQPSKVAESSSILSPIEISNVFHQTALTKAALPTTRFIIYAILGGAYIALGGLLAIYVSGGITGIAATAPGASKLLAGMVFPIGIVLVVIAGGSLFTSDCAVLPYSVWNKKLPVSKALKIATVGYFANFLGALIVAWLLGVQSGTLTAEPWRQAVTALAVHKTHLPFSQVFVKGIGANMMVCLAVWMAYASKSAGGKVLLLWIPVMAFVALGWEHSIANMFFIPAAMWLDAPISLSDFLLNNLLPATLGNITGGVVFVALPYFLLFKSAPRPNSKLADTDEHSSLNIQLRQWSRHQQNVEQEPSTEYVHSS